MPETMETSSAMGGLEVKKYIHIHRMNGIERKIAEDKSLSIVFKEFRFSDFVEHSEF